MPQFLLIHSKKTPLPIRAVTKLKKMLGTYLAPGKKSEIKTLGALQPQAEKEKLRKLQQLELCECSKSGKIPPELSAAWTEDFVGLEELCRTLLSGAVWSVWGYGDGWGPGERWVGAGNVRGQARPAFGSETRSGWRQSQNVRAESANGSYGLQAWLLKSSCVIEICSYLITYFMDTLRSQNTSSTVNNEEYSFKHLLWCQVF